MKNYTIMSWVFDFSYYEPIREHEAIKRESVYGNITISCYWNLMCVFKHDRVQPNSLHTFHYNDVIITTIASQITSLAVVCSTVYSDADQRKHQSSASLVFVWGIHRDRWIPRTKGQLRGKCFHLMTSSCTVQGEDNLLVLHGPIYCLTGVTKILYYVLYENLPPSRRCLEVTFDLKAGMFASSQLIRDKI